jgi:hypothetical protein
LTSKALHNAAIALALNFSPSLFYSSTALACFTFKRYIKPREK